MSLTQRSAWTPKSYQPDNEKMFRERLTLIKKWFGAWNSTQRWTLVEYLLQHLSDPQLIQIYDLLAPLMPPAPPPPRDFTRVLPRTLCLKIFSYLDPKSLSRAAQVCWYWRYLCECDEVWRNKCLRRGWFLPQPPRVVTSPAAPWKTHYVRCVSQLHWTLPCNAPPCDGSHSPPPCDPALLPSSPSHLPTSSLSPPHHSSSADHRRPWRDPDPHPEDLSRHTIFMTSQQPKDDYAFMKVSAKFSSITLSPGAGRRTQTQPVARSTTTPELSQLSKWPPTPHPPCATTDRTSPPQPTMHPTLLGKLRLGSPSAKHVQYSAVNRNNSRTATTALHELQQSAPFPKLPPYYTTGSNTAGWNGGTGDWNGGTGDWNGGTGDWNGDTGTGDNELSSVEKQTMRKAKGGEAVSETTLSREGDLSPTRGQSGAQLPSLPWHLPHYSDDDS